MVRLKFDPAKKGIVVSVVLVGPTGTRRVTMNVDTGSTFCIVPPKVLYAIGITPSLSAPRATLTSATSVLHLPVVIVPEVRFRGAKALAVSCVPHDLPEEALVDGLLGLSFLRKFKVRIDFKGGVLALD